MLTALETVHTLARVRRIDTPSKVSGALKYADDMTMPGMLHMAILRSPFAHATITGVDTSRAAALPGGIRVEIDVIALE